MEPEEQGNFQSTEELNIYDDLCDFDLGDEVEKLKTENRRLEQLIHTLQGDIDKLNGTIVELKETQSNLTKNISTLFITAKAEIERKDRMIQELRAQIENRRLGRYEYNPEYNKRKDRENSPLESTKLKKFKSDKSVQNDTEVDKQGSKCSDNSHESRSAQPSEKLKHVKCVHKQRHVKYSEDRRNDTEVDKQWSKGSDNSHDSRSAQASEKLKHIECVNRQRRAKYSEDRRNDTEVDKQGSKGSDNSHESRSAQPSEKLKHVEHDNRRPAKYSEDRRDDHQFDDIRHESRIEYTSDRYNESDKYDSRSKYYSDNRGNYEDDMHYARTRHPYDRYSHRHDRHDNENRSHQRMGPHTNLRRDESHSSRDNRNSNRNFVDKTIRGRDEYREDLEEYNKYPNRLTDNYDSDYYQNNQRFSEKANHPMMDLSPVSSPDYSMSSNMQTEKIRNVNDSPINSRAVTPMPLPEDIEIPKVKPPKKKLKMLVMMEKEVKSRLSQISNNSSDQCDSPNSKILNKSIDLLKILKDSDSEKSSVASHKPSNSNKSNKSKALKLNTDLKNEKLKSKGNSKVSPKTVEKMSSSPVIGRFVKNLRNISKNDEISKKFNLKNSTKDKDRETCVSKQKIGTQLTIPKINLNCNMRKTLKGPLLDKSKQQTKSEISINIPEKLTVKQMKKEQKTKQMKEHDDNKSSSKPDKNCGNQIQNPFKDSKHDAVWQNLNKLFGEDEDDMFENICETSKNVSKKEIECKSSSESVHHEKSSYNKLEEKINNIAEQEVVTKSTADESTNYGNIINEKCLELTKSKDKIVELNVIKEKSKSQCEKPMNQEKCIKQNEHDEFSKKDIKNLKKKDKTGDVENLDSMKCSQIKNVKETTEKKSLKEGVAEQNLIKGKREDEVKNYKEMIMNIKKSAKLNKSEEKCEKKISNVAIDNVPNKSDLKPTSSTQKNVEHKHVNLLSEEIKKKEGAKENIIKRNILEDEEKSNRENIEKDKVNKLEGNITIIKNVDKTLENAVRNEINKSIEDKSTAAAECHLKEKKQNSRESSKERLVPSTENLVIGRRSERIMKQREKRCSIDSVPESDKEKSIEALKNVQKNNKQQNEKEVSEGRKESTTRSVSDVCTINDNKKKDKKGLDKISKQLEQPSKLNEMLIKLNDNITEGTHQTCNDNQTSTEDLKQKRTRSVVIVEQPSCSFGSNIQQSSGNLLNQDMNKSNNETHKKSKHEKPVECEQIVKINATDPCNTEIIEQNQKQNKNDSQETKSSKNNNDNNAKEPKTIPIESGQRNRVREVKRKIRFTSTEDMLDEEVQTKLETQNISKIASVKKNVRTDLKIKESTCQPKGDVVIPSSLNKADPLNDKNSKNNSPEKIKKQTCTNSTKSSKDSSSNDTEDSSVISQSEAEECFDISLNSLKTVTKLIEINNVASLNRKNTESIPSSDSSTSEDTVVICEPDKRSIVDKKLDKLLQHYMDNFTVDDVASTSENSPISSTPVKQNMVTESNRKPEEILPESHPVTKPAEPKIKILKVVSITNSAYSVQNHTSNGVENVVITDTTVTSNFNTSTTSNLDSQTVASDIHSKKKRRITPIPVIEDKPQCSFQNILTNSCKPDTFRTTAPGIESPLHLTHEGEIPVLHLEENQLNSLPTEVNINDKNIINLLECMNISNIDCDTTKFKNISVTNDTPVNSACVDSGVNGLNFENIIDKVISGPAVTAKRQDEISGNVGSAGSAGTSNSNVGQTLQPGTQSAPFRRRRRRCRLVIKD